MTDQDRRSEQPTTAEWLRAVLIVVFVAMLVIAGLVWFAFAFVFQGCCASPIPAL